MPWEVWGLKSVIFIWTRYHTFLICPKKNYIGRSRFGTVPLIDLKDNIHFFFKAEEDRKNILLPYLFLIEDAIRAFAKLFKGEP